MAKKAKQSKNKNLIIGLCVGLAAVLIIVLIIVFARGNGLNDDYFVSDDTKYVLTFESDSADESDSEYTPLKTHIVYTYQDDQITGMKSYYVYADAASAKAAFDAMKEAASEELGQMELNGKYIIITAEEDSYKDLKASDVKQQIELMKMLEGMTSDTEENEEETEEEVVESGEEIEDEEE